LRTRREFPVDIGYDFGLIAEPIQALCGIRATGKCFPLARHRRSPRVRRTGGHSRYWSDSGPGLGVAFSSGHDGEYKGQNRRGKDEQHD
jgi:hypothetical protein